MNLISRIVKGKKKVFFVWVITYNVSLSLAAQQELRGQLGEVFYTPNAYLAEYNSPSGSPYLSTEFIPVKINDIRETKLVRFDLVKDRVEIKINETKVTVLDDSLLYNIVLLDDSGRSYQTRDYFDEKANVNSSFFEVLHNNQFYGLYLKEKKKFYKEVKAQGYQPGSKAEFKFVKSNYYITDFINNTDRLLELPQNDKSFAKLFSSNSKSILGFIKKNNLKIDNEEDLLKIFNFYFEMSHSNSGY